MTSRARLLFRTISSAVQYASIGFHTAGLAIAGIPPPVRRSQSDRSAVRLPPCNSETPRRCQGVPRGAAASGVSEKTILSHSILLLSMVLGDQISPLRPACLGTSGGRSSKARRGQGRSQDYSGTAEASSRLFKPPSFQVRLLRVPISLVPESYAKMDRNEGSFTARLLPGCLTAGVASTQTAPGTIGT